MSTRTTLVMAFDVGTSGVKAVLTDSGGAVVESAYRPYPLIALPGGGVEQDCEEIFEALSQVSSELAATLAGSGTEIAGIAVTAQMFNLVAVDGEGGPTGPMLSWLDQRADVVARKLEAEVPHQFELFGCKLTAKDIAPRILWLREERPEHFAQARWLLDCKEAVVMWMTGQAVIDPTGASAFRLATDNGTMWDANRCEAVGVDRSLLPPIRGATETAGPLRRAAARRMGLAEGIRVYVGTGDVPASQLGSGAVRHGDAHLSLGTAAYFGLLMGERRVDPAGNLAPLVHADGKSWVLWLETATGGAALAWALRLTGLSANGTTNYEQMERLVTDAEHGMGQLVLAPWFTGERVPLFDDSLRASLVGMDLHHGPGHIIRAAMLGVAYQLRWALEYGEAFGQRADRILAVGGGALGTLWSQMIADVLGRDLHCLAKAQDAAAIGAAACALVGGGQQRDFEFLAHRGNDSLTYIPRPAAHVQHGGTFERFQRLAPAAFDGVTI